MSDWFFGSLIPLTAYPPFILLLRLACILFMVRQSWANFALLIGHFTFASASSYSHPKTKSGNNYGGSWVHMPDGAPIPNGVRYNWDLSSGRSPCCQQYNFSCQQIGARRRARWQAEPLEHAVSLISVMAHPQIILPRCLSEFYEPWCFIPSELLYHLSQLKFDGENGVSVTKHF